MSLVVSGISLLVAAFGAALRKATAEPASRPAAPAVFGDRMAGAKVVEGKRQRGAAAAQAGEPCHQREPDSHSGEWRFGSGASPQVKIPDRGSARRVRFPQGTLGDRLVVGRLALNQETEVRPLLPELATRRRCLDEQSDAESSNGRMRRSERLHVGSIPASAARTRKPSERLRSLS